jgi:hypothetical protein
LFLTPASRAREDTKRKKKKGDTTARGQWDRPQVRSEGKAPAGKRSRNARLLDLIETTEQKEKEKPEHCCGWSRNDRQPVNVTGRRGWRLRQREKKEKEIKGD